MPTQDTRDRTASDVIDDLLLNLAEGLVSLLADTSELCTPGHRQGRGYQLLRDSLAGYISSSPVSGVEANVS